MPKHIRIYCYVLIPMILAGCILLWAYSFLWPDKKIIQICTLIENMPNWTEWRNSEDDKKMREQIEEICSSISTYDSNTIRKALKEYIKHNADDNSDDVSDKTFVINMYLFDYPNIQSISHLGWVMSYEQKTNGSSGSNLISDDNLQAPWSQDSNGCWRLTGRSMLFSGIPYKPLYHFDYSLKKFGRRAFPNKPINNKRNTYQN